MTSTYIVYHPEYGDIRKAADSIAEARQWARDAFGRGVRCSVVRANSHGEKCICARCERRREGR